MPSGHERQLRIKAREGLIMCAMASWVALVRRPSAAKAAYLAGSSDTAEQAAEKIDKAAKSSPQALKRDTFSTTYGTTKVVPFPKHRANQSFSAACKAVPYPRLSKNKPDHRYP